MRIIHNRIEPPTTPLGQIPAGAIFTRFNLEYIKGPNHTSDGDDDCVIDCMTLSGDTLMSLSMNELVIWRDTATLYINDPTNPLHSIRK